MLRRSLLLTAPLLALPRIGLAQAWPNRPIRVINPYAPGGTTDIIVRVLAPHLERMLGQPIIVDTRAGAGGAVGTAAGAAERPDGHTLLITNTGPLAVAPSMMANIAYDPARSFTYVTMFGGAPLLCGVAANGPIRTLADYAAAARQRREAVSFSSSGAGSMGHLAGVLWSQEARVEMLHVPFRGAPEAEQAVLGGNVTSIWNTVGAHVGSVRGGTLRGIAVSSERRVAALPDVPTVVEAGFPGSVASNWFLLAGPAGLPPEIVARLRTAIATASAEPAVRERLDGLGLVSLGDPSPEEIGRFVAGEAARWTPVVRASGATM
ncbi:Bug family tripartite tricarboxylate transporter substrate binding protein [Falsiroseomonas oryziterrae]|uniref:Bug family tripartite tricarboxylate transporter substrate binding protein n=1 Tax=Falsiroseomonas oryziterrae TaxID=2911368 RepID=UPI001F3A0352|nr:tripartite tricarboxylate transporter substrate-binding protein [Roseomonas sp. NPKOSM-4]